VLATATVNLALISEAPVAGVVYDADLALVMAVPFFDH
jgi:hypothetical protein